MASRESKSKLTIFLSENWKQECIRKKLGHVTLVITEGERCFRLSKDDVTEIVELQSTHEEADIRMMIHARHAAISYQKVVIISEDTDVLVILLSLHSQIPARVFLRRGKKNSVRLIDIQRLGVMLGKDICAALIGVHAYTGCDMVSAFSGHGKIKALNLINKSSEYRELFTSFGQEFQVTENYFQRIQAFTCSMYCTNTNIKLVNELRYELFRAKSGDISSGQLPPCSDALRQHTNRANYQAAIWRRSLEHSPQIPCPTDCHGWSGKEGQMLEICWFTGPPAPDIVLELMSCRCSKHCGEDCTCVKHGLYCNPTCNLQDCANVEDDNEWSNDTDDSDGEHDEDY